ncbi:MAG TPA: hypothetical protein VKR30_06720 [Candidatus Limnocylindrales bacterium]|nr:hypothetical protein [Candidatus Limnocylindrales bacterium]
MFTPQAAEWAAGRALPSRDRDAEQLADLRAALAKCRPTAIERLQAFLARSQAPNCDCAE